MSTLGNNKANGYVSGSDLDPTINLPANANMLFTPTGGITSSNVKAALAELDTKKAVDTAVVHNTGSETIAGLKTFSTSPVVPAAASTGQVVNYDQVIGIGQTWYNVTASRALGVTYTNTTGKPIVVLVQAGNVGSNSVLQLLSGGVTTWAFSAAGYTCSTSIIVPNGFTYRLTTGTNYTTWMELR